MPEEFHTYLHYCRNLKFEERPDYNHLRKIFKDLMYKRGHDYDYQFDWVLKKAGNKIPENDYADAKPTAGNVAAAQGKELPPKVGGGFGEERKENRAKLGEQVVNGF
jgi:hypothetical protein